MSRVQVFAPVASRLVLVCRTAARGIGGSSAGLLGASVRLGQTEPFQWCVSVRGHAARLGAELPKSLPMMLNGIKDAQAAMDAAQWVATSDPRLKVR